MGAHFVAFRSAKGPRLPDGARPTTRVERLPCFSVEKTRKRTLVNHKIGIFWRSGLNASSLRIPLTLTRTADRDAELPQLVDGVRDVLYIYSQRAGGWLRQWVGAGRLAGCGGQQSDVCKHISRLPGGKPFHCGDFGGELLVEVGWQGQCHGSVGCRVRYQSQPQRALLQAFEELPHGTLEQWVYKLSGNFRGRSQDKVAIPHGGVWEWTFYMATAI